MVVGSQLTHTVPIMLTCQETLQMHHLMTSFLFALRPTTTHIISTGKHKSCTTTEATMATPGDVRGEFDEIFVMVGEAGVATHP